jgi:hypothetical protein
MGFSRGKSLCVKENNINYREMQGQRKIFMEKKRLMIN